MPAVAEREGGEAGEVAAHGWWPDLSVRTEHHGLPSSASARVQRQWVTLFKVNGKIHFWLSVLLVATVRQATAINIR
jgi:hypothetical protein